MAFSLRLGIVLILLLILNLFFYSKRRWDCIFSLLFVILLFIPPDLVGIISGYPYSSSGRINISIVGYDVFIVWLCLFVNRSLKLKISQNLFFNIMGRVFFLFLLRLCVNGMDGLSNKMLDNYLLPVLLALLIICYMPREIFPSVLRTIIICLIINALISCFEVVLGKSMLLHSYYMETVAWYQGLYGVTVWNISMRGTAFLGHPLVNGMYYVLGIAYLYNCDLKKRRYLKIIALLILFCGVLASNSRGALIIAVGYTGFSLLSRRKYGKISVMVFAATVALGMLDFDALYSSFFLRDLSGSSLMHRLISLQSVMKIPFTSLLFGTGYNNTSNALQQIGIAGNFEVAYLILILENGLIGFVVWLRSLTLLYKTKMISKFENINVRKAVNGMILCMMGLAATGNYFGDPGTLNYMLWSLFAFSKLMCGSGFGETGMPRTGTNRSIGRKYI